MKTNQLPKSRRGLSIALRISAMTPWVLALLMFVVTPTYFRPMVQSYIGWLLLIIFATAVWVAHGFVELGIWLFRKGRVVVGVLVLVCYSMTWLMAVSIVLLGPAALILMKPRS